MTPTPEPAIWWTRGPRKPRAVALALHGGMPKSNTRPRRFDPAVMRMRLFTAALAIAGRRRGLRVEMLRYRVRGWNEGSPIPDARWALDDIARRHPGLPIVVLGHSMGGRTALRLMDDPRVVAVVTAALWVELADLPVVCPHDGLSTLLMHGTNDRVTSPRGTVVTADHLRSQGARVEVLNDVSDGHAMMRRALTWHRAANQFLLSALH